MFLACGIENFGICRFVNRAKMRDGARRQTLVLVSPPRRSRVCGGACILPCRFGTMQDLGDALKAAMAEPGPAGYGVGPTSQLPGASAQTGAAVPPAAGVPPVAMQTPEEVEQNRNNIWGFP